MCKELDFIVKVNNTDIYSISHTNSYIISNYNTRELLTKPEIVGYDITRKIYFPISDMLKYIRSAFSLENINIVNILRGGLNFPIEESCYDGKINIAGTSFLTSERLFIDGKVSQIESKYQKVLDVSNATIIIGDIIASGETLSNTLRFVVEKYKQSKKSIKRIIVFTIGTINALGIKNKLENEFKKYWDSFEGIYFVFFEAVFTTYSSNGITRLNLSNVDFFFNGGLLVPNYRDRLFEDDYALFEKCAIYDGGARRFEKNLHITSILDYWFNLSKVGFNINLQELFIEKMGYSVSNNFYDWIKVNGYVRLDKNKLYDLYIKEKQFFNNIKEKSINCLAEDRYNTLLSYYGKSKSIYEN